MPAVHREAKARLTEMNVQEVSLVDKAANERVFAITKRDGQMKMTKAQWAAKAKTLKSALTAVMSKLSGDKAAGVAKLEFKLPSEAKQSLMDALADALDKLTALATMVGDAEVDDASPVPEELAAALVQVAEMLEGTASQYAAGGEEQAPPPAEGQQQGGDTAAAGAPPPGAEKAAKLSKAELDNLTAATVTIQAAREQLWSVSDLMGKDPGAAAEKVKGIVTMLDNAAQFMSAGTGGAAPAAAPAEGGAEKAQKGLPPELHDGDALKAEMHDGDSLKELLHKCIAAGHLTQAKLSKAGRKIAGKRYEQLKNLHDTLGKLLNELAYDEAAGAEKAAPPAPPPPKGKKPGEEEAPPAPAKKSADGAAEAEPTLADLKKQLDASVAKANEERVALEKRIAEIGKRAGVPASAPLEGAPPPAPEDGVTWPMDMSAHVAQKRGGGTTPNKPAPGGKQ